MSFFKSYKRQVSIHYNNSFHMRQSHQDSGTLYVLSLISNTFFFHWNFMHRDCTYLHVHISDIFFSRWKFEHRDILYILMNTDRGSEVASAFDNDFSKLFFVFFWQFFFLTSKVTCASGNVWAHYQWATPSQIWNGGEHSYKLIY